MSEKYGLSVWIIGNAMIGLAIIFHSVESSNQEIKNMFIENTNIKHRVNAPAIYYANSELWYWHYHNNPHYRVLLCLEHYLHNHQSRCHYRQLHARVPTFCLQDDSPKTRQYQ